MRINDKIFDFAVICCLVMVRLGHIWTTIQIWPSLTITRQHMTAKSKLLSFILFDGFKMTALEYNPSNLIQACHWMDMPVFGSLWPLCLIYLLSPP